MNISSVTAAVASTFGLVIGRENLHPLSRRQMLREKACGIVCQDRVDVMSQKVSNSSTWEALANSVGWSPQEATALDTAKKQCIVCETHFRRPDDAEIPHTFCGSCWDKHRQAEESARYSIEAFGQHSLEPIAKGRANLSTTEVGGNGVVRVTAIMTMHEEGVPTFFVLKRNGDAYFTAHLKSTQGLCRGDHFNIDSGIGVEPGCYLSYNQAMNLARMVKDAAYRGN
jgi:hypothetical protein